MMKKLISIVLTVVFAVTMTAVTVYSTGTTASAAFEEGNTAAKGVYWFDPHELGMDLTDTFIYDDELLKGDSLEYNQQLATMSFELAITSISSEREPKTEEGYAGKSRNLKAYLEDNGFIDFETNQYYKEKMTTRSMGAACAHKQITDGGKVYTLIAIVPRSAGYESEWGGNFMINDPENAADDSDHWGFKHGMEIVLDFAKQYIEDHGITGDIKVWTAGYSRGAGVSNEVGAALIAEPENYLGGNVSLTPDNLYCYTFGTPKTASTVNPDFGDSSDSKFNYIHNTWEAYDIVTVAPPAGFGFSRYGTNTRYDHRDGEDAESHAQRKERMLKMLKETNSQVYDIYMNGGDPDGFSPKILNIEALIGNGKFEIENDNESYLPSNQAEFMAMMEESLMTAVKTRAEYSEGFYQQALEDFCGYFFSHTEKLNELIGGIQGSSFVMPMAASLYVSYMLEQYSNQTFDQATIDEMEKELNALDSVIKQLINDDIEVPEEIQAAYSDLMAEFEGITADVTKWDVIVNASQELSAALFSEVIGEGLTKAGLPDENQELFDRITGVDESKALSRSLAYLLLYDKLQTDQKISFTTVTQQIKHMATFIGNAKSYMRPHNNEIVLSWLRTLDSNYDDYTKENDAQKAGYRRCYISQPEGVDVTGKVLDDAGNTVAIFKNSSITSRTDKWIGITTSDNGNWLRLPVDKSYSIEINVSSDTILGLKTAEWSVYDGKEVRTVTNDEKYDWSKLSVKSDETVSWVISAVDADYSLPSQASYYIEKTAPAVTPLMAKAVSKGKQAAKISWNKISGAQRYVVYLANNNTSKKTYKLKKVKTLSAAKTNWIVKKLSKNTAYKFKVVAQKKVNGKYKNIKVSKISYFITGNSSGKFTNPKSMSLSKSSVSLRTGKSVKITGKVTRCVAGKKFLTNASKLRFVSNRPSVAKVNSKGKITAVAKGTCKIYVQSVNGIWNTVKVTVK